MAESPGVLILVVVDDEDAVREMIVAALEDGGYAIAPVASAQRAFALLDERGAELGGLVTDIDLGRGESAGWDVARKARELNPAIPVVYISEGSGEAWPANGVPHSVLLAKPFAPADLVVALAGLRTQD